MRLPLFHFNNLGDGQYETRARKFSLLKAINARLGEDVDVGFEREISQEVTRRAGRKFSGIAVPDEYFQVEKRTLLVGSSAAQLYPEQHRDDLFIDTLRARLIVGQLGATVLDGLIGDQDIPRQTASSTAQWVAEDGSLTETDPTFDDVTLSPKTVGAMTSYSRRTLINALPSIEQLVRNDLAAVIANAIDEKALIGTGAGNTPTGVANASGVNSASLATPTWAQVLAFVSAIQGANADIGALAWAMAPRSVAKLRSTVRVATTDSVMLMESENRLAGYPVAVSTSLAEDSRGLAFDLDLPDTSIGRDVLALAERSDLGGMSFAFVPIDEHWDGTKRELRSVDLKEISVVSAWPAYERTEIAARSRPTNFVHASVARRFIESL